MRLVAAYRWELWLLVGGVSCFYPAQAWTAAVTPPGWEWVALAASWSLPAVGMYLLYGRARRRERGLEFLLIIGIPFAAYLARAVSAAAVPFLAIAIPWFWDYGITGYFLFLALVKIPSPFTAAALLAIGLRYVRRRQRGFLGMAWMMLLAAALLELAVEAYQVAAIQFFPSLNLSALRFGYATLPGFFITAPLTMLLALRFARQASKISLAHAFFIVGLAFAFPISRLLLEISPNEESDSSIRLAALTVTRTAVATFALAATLAIVWLLGNFDRRGDAFNARAAAALFGIQAAIGVAAAIPLVAEGGALIARDAPLVGGVIIGWGVTLALAYLLRVRQPALERTSA